MKTFTCALLTFASIASSASAHETAEAHQHGGSLLWLGVLAVAVGATGLIIWMRNKTRARD